MTFGCCHRCAGGYEHVCKVWDVRAKSATMSLDHGAPIEALAYFPSGCVPLACVNALLSHSDRMGHMILTLLVAK